MMEWIWAGALLATTLWLYSLEIRRGEDFETAALGYLFGTMTSLFALGCVRAWVIWPPLKWLHAWIPEQGTLLHGISLCVIALIALALYYVALLSVANGLVRLGRRFRHSANAGAPVAPSA